MLAIIDGTYLSCRIYRILEENFSSEIFINLFLKKVRTSLAFVKANHCLVTFSDFRRSHRKNSLDNYCYAPPYFETLLEVEKDLFERLSKSGIHMCQKDGFESKDIISTIHSKLRKSGDHPIVIISKDKLLLSLLDKHTRTYDPFAKENDAFETEESFLNKNTIHPKLFLDVLMMAGIKNLGHDGISGVGEKKAIEIVKNFGDLNSIYLSRHLISGKIGERVAKEVHELVERKRVYESQVDVSLGFNFSDIKYTRGKSFGLML